MTKLIANNNNKQHVVMTAVYVYTFEYKGILNNTVM